MKTDDYWNDFLKSGRVDDYISFVNSRRESFFGERNTEPYNNRSTGDKGNEVRGE